jgi:hypothetical protein
MGSSLGVMPGLFGSTDDKAEQVDFLQEFFCTSNKDAIGKNQTSVAFIAQASN